MARQPTGIASLHKDEILHVGALVMGDGASIDATQDEAFFVSRYEHSGRVIIFGKLTGQIITLPPATGTGNAYTFVETVMATSNANLIRCDGTDVLSGSVAMQQAGTQARIWVAVATDNTITFAGAADGIIGTRISCIDYKAGYWSCQMFGGGTSTPFSTTVG